MSRTMDQWDYGAKIEQKLRRENRIWWRGFVWGFAAAALCALVATYTASVRGDVTVAPTHRVGNRSDHGICWWACAQTAGNHAGIVPLQTLVDKVVQTGIGFREGATPETIAHWLTELGVKAEYRASGDKDAAFLTGSLKRGLPVVVTLHPWGPEQGHHAVLLLRVGVVKEHWSDGNNVPHHDYLVRYYDPNHPEHTYVTTWTWFWGKWTGRAYAFDPKQQDSKALAQGSELRPGRLMLDGSVQPNPPRVVAPTPALRPLPYAVPWAGPVRKVPSNQDLKDGVRRPADTLSYPHVFSGHNYHADTPRR